MKNFALIGVGGFVAPRHLKAIKETGNSLIAAVDKCDQVGILDSYFPNADFFIEFERFERHLERLKRMGIRTDYVSICSPNYLHDSHIRFALRHGATAICEKPLVLNPWNVDALAEIEAETGKRIYTILQLRLHPTIIALKNRIQNSSADKVYEVELQYITSRGKWYDISWKGEISKSGGIATNIGIHFFDMLLWIFGPVKDMEVKDLEKHYASGTLELEKARVKWFLSIDENHLPPSAAPKRTYRSLKLEGEEIEFSEGFSDLHTQSYQGVLNEIGFGLLDAKPSIQLVHDIRHFKQRNKN